MQSAKPAPEMAAHVAAFRRFNRFYTRVLGLLAEQLVESGFSLTEARVLFELAARTAAEARPSVARDIGEELGLDAGYLSRILRGLEDSGLIVRRPMARDARNAIVKLTRKGKSAFAELDRRSSTQAVALLEPLLPDTRLSLIRSMQAIETALSTQPARSPLVLRPHRPGDMGWVISRNGAVYAQEYGWDQSYEALVARICADFLDNFKPARERCWIAERDGERLGCIFCVQHPERADTAKLRLLLVEPAARGLGLGRALVNECVSFARGCGYKRMTLWTQSILTAAHHLYEQAGFRLKHEEPHRSFGADLVSQTWETEL
jgi:DNA-binding MarR family transcriptional regulator/GNAT superfamily N-acetyltransferase